MMQSLFAMASDGREPVSLTVLPSNQGEGGYIYVQAIFGIAPKWKIYAPQHSDTTQRCVRFDWPQLTPDEIPEVIWPKPDNVTENKAQVQIYQNQARIWFKFNAHLFKKHPSVKGRASWIACSNQCVPMSQEIKIQLFDKKNVNPLNFLSPITGKNHTLWAVIVMGFVGGFILNFMPCVLPVLSLKLRSLMTTHSNSSKTSLRVQMFATLCGILISFMALASLAVILKSTQHLFTWGMHFQNPVFLIFMSAILSVFTLSFLNLIEIKLPNLVQNKLNSISHRASIQVHDWLSGMTSGMLAALLATPCTAPFLGTALSYALTQSPFIIYSLFFIMGLGFASPYVLALLIPARLMIIPKAGPWMIWFNRSLVILTVITTIWLLWSLTKMVGIDHVIYITACLIIFNLILILWHKKRVPKTVLMISLFGIILMSILRGYHIQHSSDFVQEGRPDVSDHWSAFSTHALKQALTARKIIFVDVTAAWCATCQINKLNVLQNPQVLNKLKSQNVVALRADWTQHTPDISQFLAHYHRSGIPFYIVYGPRAPQGLILPEILTQDIVLKALEQAGHIL